LSHVGKRFGRKRRLVILLGGITEQILQLLDLLLNLDLFVIEGIFDKIILSALKVPPFLKAQTCQVIILSFCSFPNLLVQLFITLLE